MCLCFDCHVIAIPYHRITWLRPPYNEKPVPIQVNTREKYELLWFEALWQRYCQLFYWVCQTIQNRTTQYIQLRVRPRYAQCMIQTATSSSICPPTPGSPSAQFCTEHKLPFLHTAAGQHSVCNVTRSKYPRRWCPRPRLQLAGSTLPHALEPASTCTICTYLRLQA